MSKEPSKSTISLNRWHKPYIWLSAAAIGIILFNIIIIAGFVRGFLLVPNILLQQYFEGSLVSSSTLFQMHMIFVSVIIPIIVSVLDMESKLWFNSNRHSLRHRIDPRIFFGKKLVLTEGGSDTNFLMESTRYFATIDPELDIHNKNIMIVNVDGKGNFATYKRLLDSLSIPYIMLGDQDVLDTPNVSAMFTNHKILSKDGILESPNSAGVYVIHGGNLEYLMRELNQEIYSDAVREVEKYHGRYAPKSAVAAEYIDRLSKSKPELLAPIRMFLQRVIG